MTTAYFREETHKRLYSFSIRQKYIEDALRVAIYEVDSTALRAPAKLVDYTLTSSRNDDFPILATIQEGQETYHVCWFAFPFYNQETASNMLSTASI